jgi:ferritin-like metal-binding protein YciE
VRRKPSRREIRQLKNAFIEHLEQTKGHLERLKDAGIIAAAQRVEHYEMAGYARYGLSQNCWERKKQPNFLL